MTNTEKQLLSSLLEIASDVFSNHGCNDLFLTFMIPKEHKIKMAKEYHEWNGDPEKFTGNPEDFNIIPD